jgi:manganese-dependent inorganic pyrophosphatase
MINQSLPIRHFMTANPTSFEENAYIDDIRGTMTNERYRDFPIKTKDGRYNGMISRRNLIDMDSKQFVLVDHNEVNQAIAGIQEAEVLEIVDHHKLGTIETMKPVIVRNRPVGCTATIIAQMYEENDVEMTPETAGLLCSAIISDTLLFRSPTCTPLDEETARHLAVLANIDPEQHAVAMFDAGSDFKSKSVEDIFYQDFKKFKAGEHSFGIGQISSMNAGELKELRDRIRPFLEQAREREGADMIFFLLTDILAESSWMICAGEKAEEMAAAGFGEADENGNFLLKGVVSRKKQFVPVMMEQLMA